MSTFSLRLNQVGVASAPRLLRGYITPQSGGSVVMHVAVPPGASSTQAVQAYADGVAVPSSRQEGLIVFTLPTQVGRPADWAVRALSTGA
jgi:hypothetical protein